MSLVESMDLASRRCEQSIHDSRRLSAQFPEVVALLEQYRAGLLYWCAALPQERQDVIMARIDKCLAALKGQS